MELKDKTTEKNNIIGILSKNKKKTDKYQNDNIEK